MNERQESDGPRQRSDARSRLLEATITCIQERGRVGATAREIATRAEVNLGSIGYYFGSKDELIDQACVTACERWTGYLLENGFASAPDGPLAKRIATSLGTFLSSLGQNRPLALGFLEALASADRSPDVRSALVDYYDELRDAVAEDTGNGGSDVLGRAVAAASAIAIVALFDGLLIQWLLDPDLELNPLELVGSLGSLLDLE
jgi:AcrR family transcriptional regulator